MDKQMIQNGPLKISTLSTTMPLNNGSIGPPSSDDAGSFNDGSLGPLYNGANGVNQ